MSDASTAVEQPAKLPNPPGLWVLIFTETWERFSHYGMRALLILYLTTPAATGGLGLDKPRAAAIFGGYLLSIYLFSLNGGQIADRFLGTKRTIVLGGLFIAAGQLLLQVRNLTGLIASLVLIAIGTCLLKPNISASVGRLFTRDDPRRDGAFTFEYMGINTGAFVAPIICGFMAESPTFQNWLAKIGLNSASGWSWAFGVSGVGMLLGLLNFVLRRKLVEDVTLEGQKEPAPKGMWFVAILVAALLGMAWVVVGAKEWYNQLLLGAVGAAAIMIVVQMLVNRGLIPTRAKVVSASGQEESHQLTQEDRNRLIVVGMMLLFSISFWLVFQQAGSTLNLFAKDYTKRVYRNHEASQIQVLQGNLGTEYRPFLKQLENVDTQIFQKGSRTLQDIYKKPAAQRPASPGLSATELEILKTRDGLVDKKAEYDKKVKDLEDRKVTLIEKNGGFEIPASWLQSVNALLIVALGPLFAMIWAKRAGRFPSSPVKFAMGLMFASLGFFLLVPAARIIQGTPGTITQVNMSWLIGVYFIHTLGELSLSPVGLAYVSRLAPKHLTSQLMGAWFFSLGIGAYLAGKAAGFMDAVPLWQIFAFGAVIAMGMSLLLWFVVSRFIHKLMGGHS